MIKAIIFGTAPNPERPIQSGRSIAPWGAGRSPVGGKVFYAVRRSRKNFLRIGNANSKKKATRM